VINLGDAEAVAGDPVELVGRTTAGQPAQAADAVAHEILVRLRPRAERVYLGA
jgi:alanine racemase